MRSVRQVFIAEVPLQSNPCNAAKGRELVKRVLNKVFTNGTLMDGEYLNDEEAGHCISIRVKASTIPVRQVFC